MSGLMCTEAAEEGVGACCGGTCRGCKPGAGGGELPVWTCASHAAKCHCAHPCACPEMSAPIGGSEEGGRGLCLWSSQQPAWEFPPRLSLNHLWSRE